MIVDAFLFDSELLMLELRLHTLAPVVDRFLLCEATETFTGHPKPLHYAEHADEPRFAPFKGRIIHVVVDDLPATRDPWAREAFQRNAIRRGLNHCAPDDIVLIGDVDELPNPGVTQGLDFYMREAEDPSVYATVAVAPDPPIIRPKRPTIAFQQTLYQFTLNWRHPQTWYGTRAIRYRNLELPQMLRGTTAPLASDTVIVPHGGWSFSSMGTPAAIRRKLASFSHAEVDTPELNNLEHIEEVQRTGKGFAPWDSDLVYQSLDDSYPPYLLEHRERFESWLHDREIAAGWPH